MNTLLLRSFGRRKARKLRVTSQKAYDTILPRLKINLEKEIFEISPPEIWFEIGFGGGEHMLTQLAQHPSIAMVGCEPFTNGIAKFLAHLSPQDFERVRLWPEDVRLLLEVIPSSYFSRAFILFPDPWPKKRHQRRRLINHEFIKALLPTLKERALLYVASDDMSYVEQIQDILYSHPSLNREEGPPSADPSTWGLPPKEWVSTPYEQKALKKGKPCAYMIFRKKSPSS